jgi:hypothetical protein
MDEQTDKNRTRFHCSKDVGENDVTSGKWRWPWDVFRKKIENRAISGDKQAARSFL